MRTDQETGGLNLAITRKELKTAAVKLMSGKAPDPDGIYNMILILVVRWNLVVLLRACVRHRTFPRQWKRARIVLLHKVQGRPVDQPGSFRSISLLNGANKLFERILLNQISLLPCPGLPVSESDWV